MEREYQSGHLTVLGTTKTGIPGSSLTIRHVGSDVGSNAVCPWISNRSTLSEPCFAPRQESNLRPTD